MALTKCTECGREISDKAGTCPGCGAPIGTMKRAVTATPVVPREPKIGKATATVAWMVLGPVIAIGIIGSVVNQANRPSGPLESEPTASEPAANPDRKIIKITSTALHQNYERNEVLTDQQFGDAIIEITGIVDSIGKDFMDDVVLQLRIKGEPFQHTSVELVDSERKTAAALRKGERIAAQCDRVKFVIGSPAGYDCTLVPTEQPAAN